MTRKERRELQGRMEAEAHGRVKFRIVCPECTATRGNKKDKSLSVNMNEKVCHCFHCGYTVCWKGVEDFGVVPGKDLHLPAEKPAHYRLPVFNSNETVLSDRLVRYFVEERCIPQQVLVDMKIGERMEWMPQTSKEENCICFNYFETGKLVNVKFRDGAKHFKMVKGAELIPWNIDSLSGADICYVCEGEMDALSLLAAGYKAVISVPNGAGGDSLKWLDRFIESHFDDKQKIVLALDMDKRGVDLREELIRRLGVDICYVVKWGPGCKDANEHLVRYGMESLRIAVEQAKEIPLEGVFCATDVADELWDIFRNGMPAGIDTGLENLDKVTTFEVNRVLTVTGIPGSGKSEFVDELVLRFLLGHGWRAAYFSPENRPLSYHLRKLIMKLVGKRFESRCMAQAEAEQAINYLAENVFSVSPADDFTVDAVLATMASLVCRKGIRTVVIDPFNRFEHQIPKGETETQYISRLFDKFNNFAMRYHVLLIIVAHPVKLRRDPGTGKFPIPTLYDISGSAAFYNKSDFGMIVYRNRETCQTMIRIDKVRLGHLGDNGAAFFRYNDFNGRYVPMEEETAGTPAKEPVWDNTNWLSKVLEAEQGEINWE